jgi:aryl-alcohol dehydrogenase-like predicted oxidoreductase
MKDQSSGIDRRSFFKAGLTAGAAAVTVGAANAAAPENKDIKRTGKIPERMFGKTGHMLPVLGHGGSAMVDQWASGYNVELEDQDTRVAMVREAYNSGVRYFDTARVYGESERIMGEALKDVRDNCYIASKVADPRPAKTRESVEKTLSELGTDYIDCMQVHSPAIERVGVKGGMAIREELGKLQDEGLIRFTGVTTHIIFKEIYEMVDTEAFDQVLLARGYMNRGMTNMISNESLEWREKTVARAHELNMGIVAMKVMGLNMIGRGNTQVVADYDDEKRAALPGAALRWALNDERIGILNIGMSVTEDIGLNMKTITGDLTLTEADKLLLADYAEKAYASPYTKAMQYA